MTPLRKGGDPAARGVLEIRNSRSYRNACSLCCIESCNLWGRGSRRALRRAGSSAGRRACAGLDWTALNAAGGASLADGLRCVRRPPAVRLKTTCGDGLRCVAGGAGSLGTRTGNPWQCKLAQALLASGTPTQKGGQLVRARATRSPGRGGGRGAGCGPGRWTTSSIVARRTAGMPEIPVNISGDTGDIYPR